VRFLPRSLQGFFRPPKQVAIALPLGKTFNDIPVVPGFKHDRTPLLCSGGPIWPEFSSQTDIRARRKDDCCDVEPPMPDGPLKVRRGEFAWGGQLFHHFGHLTAETCPRLVWSLRRWPDSTYLFLASPEESEKAVPDFIWTMLAWHGLRRDRVEVITAPFRAETLHVMPLPEWLNGPPPPDGYLDILADTARQNRMKAVPCPILYVSRSGLLKERKGGHAGEAYLEHLLQALGVSVMEPSGTPLAEQLARYAGAQIIVFAEGSAAHGRQFLGRIDQKIMILNRRRSNRLAFNALASRVTELGYCEATRATMAMVGRYGQPLDALGLAFYDPPELFAAFESLGINLEGRWNDNEYHAVRNKDIIDWLARLYNRPDHFDFGASVAQVENSLRQEGLELAVFAAAVQERKGARQRSAPQGDR
jgi:Glycosyltransferase 61